MRILDEEELIKQLYDSDSWVGVALPQNSIGWKLHVSVHPEDYPEFLKRILPILRKYGQSGIGSKFAPLSYIRENFLTGTQQGKFVTIYVPEELSSLIPYLIREIEYEFRKGGFRRYKLPPNERPVGKEGIISVRFSEFYGKNIEVPENYRQQFGESIWDGYIRCDISGNGELNWKGVPPWKEEEFKKIFGSVYNSLEESKAEDLKNLDKIIYQCTELFDGDFPQDYKEKIKERVSLQKPIIVPRIGSYRILVGGKTIGRIEDGILYIANWYSPLLGDLYVVGRYGYEKFSGGKKWFREFRVPLDKRVSRVQLLIKPGIDSITVYNLGLNEIEIVPYEEKKKYFEYVLLLFSVGFVPLLYLIMSFRPKEIGNYLLVPSSYISAGTVALIFVLVIAIFLIWKKKSVVFPSRVSIINQ